MLMALRKIAGISPAQTDNSNTAAIGAPSRNIRMATMALVIARPTTALSRYVVIVVHIAASTIAASSTTWITFSSVMSNLCGGGFESLCHELTQRGVWI